MTSFSIVCTSFAVPLVLLLLPRWVGERPCAVVTFSVVAMTAFRLIAASDADAANWCRGRCATPARRGRAAHATPPHIAARFYTSPLPSATIRPPHTQLEISNLYFVTICIMYFRSSIFYKRISHKISLYTIHCFQQAKAVISKTKLRSNEMQKNNAIAVLSISWEQQLNASRKRNIQMHIMAQLASIITARHYT